MQAFERMRSLSIDVIDHLVNVNEASDRGLFRHTVLILTVFVLYCTLGIVVYTVALGWDFLDALYFIVITFSTVGYGDLDPQTPAEKLFTSFYLLIGLIALMTFLSVHLALVAEHNEALAAEKSKRIASKIAEAVDGHSKGLFATVADNLRRLSHSISESAQGFKRTFSFSSTGNSHTNSPNSSKDREQTADVKRLQREILEQANDEVSVGAENPLAGRNSGSTGRGSFNTISSVQALKQAHASQGVQHLAKTTSAQQAEAAAALGRAAHEIALRDDSSDAAEVVPAPPPVITLIPKTEGGGSDVRESFTASMRAEAMFGSGAKTMEAIGVLSAGLAAKGNKMGVGSKNTGSGAVIVGKPFNPVGGLGLARSPNSLTGLTGGLDLGQGAFGTQDGMGTRNAANIMQTPPHCAKTRHIETMQQIMMDQWDQDLAELKQGAISNFFVIMLCVVLGFLGMMQIEGWDANESFYWACQTVTTVGYGDCPPTSKGGKVFTIFYIIFGVGFVGKAIGDIVKYPMMLRSRHVEEKVLKQFGGDLSDEKLKMIFHSEMYERNPSLRANENEMSKMEFIVLVLEMMNKVQEKDILLVSKIFDRLDANGDGALNGDDMQLIRAAAQLRDTEQARREQQRREEEDIIRTKQEEEAQSKSLYGALTGHMYDLLAGMGLVDNDRASSSTKKRGSSSMGNSKSSSIRVARNGSKQEGELLITGERGTYSNSTDSDSDLNQSDGSSLTQPLV